MPTWRKALANNGKQVAGKEMELIANMAEGRWTITENGWLKEGWKMIADMAEGFKPIMENWWLAVRWN